jgi:BCD family chlorophyll transporter-like MFS transporter
MGLWGAAQGIAFALGGLLGTAAVDLTRSLMDSPVPAYATVFAGEAVMFLIAAVLATRVMQPVPRDDASPSLAAKGEPATEMGAS